MAHLFNLYKHAGKIAKHLNFICYLIININMQKSRKKRYSKLLNLGGGSCLNCTPVAMLPFLSCLAYSSCANS